MIYSQHLTGGMVVCQTETYYTCTIQALFKYMRFNDGRYFMGECPLLNMSIRKGNGPYSSYWPKFPSNHEEVRHLSKAILHILVRPIVRVKLCDGGRAVAAVLPAHLGTPSPSCQLPVDSSHTFLIACWFVSKWYWSLQYATHTLQHICK